MRVAKQVAFHERCKGRSSLWCNCIGELLLEGSVGGIFSFAGSRLRKGIATQFLGSVEFVAKGAL